LNSAISDETTARESAITATNETLTDEASTRAASVGTLSSVIYDETLGEDDWAQFQQTLSSELQLSNMIETNIDFSFAQEKITSEVDEVKAEATRTKVLAAAFNDGLEQSIGLLASTESVTTMVGLSETKLTQDLTSVIADETTARESAISIVTKSVTDETGTRTEDIKTLNSKVEDGDATTLSSAQEYTRTAVGYCLDSDGEITGENNSVICVTDGGSWFDGALAEFVRNLQVTNANGTSASIADIRQVFEDKDGTLVARGGMTNDVNGRITGFLNSNDGEESNFDIIADTFRVGTYADDGETFIPSLSLDQTDPDDPVMRFLGTLELKGGEVFETVEDIRAEVLIAGTLIRSPKIESIGEEYMLISSSEGFGVGSKFMEWYGRNQLINGEVDYANLRKANAITYRTVDGDAYLSGTLISGDLNTSKATSDLSSDANVQISIGSNEGLIAVNYSISLSSEYNNPNGSSELKDGDIPVPKCVVIFQQYVNGNWANKAYRSLTGESGVYYSTYEAEGGGRWLNSGYQSLDRGFTFYDSEYSSDVRDYRLIMTSRTDFRQGTYWTPSQRLSLTSSEG
jgi:hypothetical protein